MKKIILSLLIAVVAGFVSCRKTDTDVDINQYDDEQIQAYIKTNGITGMQKDASGVYYKVLKTGTGSRFQYSDSVGFVYTLHSFDGQYASVDTIANHYTGYLGHISEATYPLSLQTAIYELVKNYGGKIRLLIPSHLAYGAKGIGTGSSTTVNVRIAGNQCLDYYINVMNNQPGDNQNTYDDLVIKNYLAAKGLTGYQRTSSGLYYLITRPGVGTTPVTNNSYVNCFYTTGLLNGLMVDQNNDAPGAQLEVPEVITGIREAFKSLATTGAKMTIIMPSSLAYGQMGVKANNIPGNSCLRFDVQVLNVTP
ncbi:FKBP-type peptidyl-prolyl cis-trans isomerase [Mucilaginibacter calamicampi]|uniref:Peptidyl-prolyl cis-trans isomerase n=1 Tax=Mucilaginibacter calamicampi TaxID=1302352 RepID=A0ABW2YRF0_9SPHI